MHVLVIGGTRFLGQALVWHLLAAGHQVTLLNRGTRPDAFGGRVERLQADRTTPAFADALRKRHFDATVDFAAYKEADVRGVVEGLGERAGHYVLISTGQVYLVCPDAPRPASEEHYGLPVMAEPAEPAEREEWLYGVGKRACEDVLVEAAAQGFRATRLRLPMVNGAGDYYQRLDGYCLRILDGGPLLLPKGLGRDCRHVYGDDVAAQICALLAQGSGVGEAYNLCQDEVVPLPTLLALLGEVLGAAKVRLVEVEPQALEAARLSAKSASPFSVRWMSCLSPEKARAQLKFRHTPLREYLARVVAAFRAHPPPLPAGYAQRAAELALAKRLLGSAGA